MKIRNHGARNRHERRALGRHIHHRVPDPPEPSDGDEDKSGGGGGDDPDLKHPAIQAAIQAGITTATAGLKTKNAELLGESRDTATKLKALEETWGGLDPEAVKSLLHQFENDEDAKLIAEGKFDQVMAKRTEALARDWETRLNAALAQITERDDLLGSKDRTIHRLQIDHQVRAACAAAEINFPGAIEDAVAMASTVFSVGEDGDSLVARGEGGTLLMGKDGVKPLTPAEWLGSQKEDRAHWWGTSAGSGSSGGSGQDRSSTDVENLTPRGKLRSAMGGG